MQMSSASRLVAVFFSPLLLLSSSSVFAAADPKKDGAVFKEQIQPLLKEYCLKCHSTEDQKGDLDLEVFSSLEAIKKHPKIWQNVAEQLASNEMPPKKKPQPTPEQRERLTKWVQETLDAMALANAGDPGPVVLRRLSNAEYTYTVRDLLGVESLEPVKEFPVDGAAGEGFTNTGQALVMSPALMTKYLDAAKGIAAHAVLLPDGLRFSPKTTKRDWTEEVLVQIREFYRGFTEGRSGEKLSLQGVPVDMVNEGGRLPVEKYLAATLTAREALTAGSKTIETAAAEHGLNAKYLGALWSALTAKEPSLLLDRVRARWREAKPADAVAIAADIAQWQKALWKFSSVGHIGKVGGPKAWMEPVNPVTAKQEVRMKLAPAAGANEVTLYLVATDAGDGNENDFAVWQQPRLTGGGESDLHLRDVRQQMQQRAAMRDLVLGSAAKCLAAAADASATEGQDPAAVAQKHGVDPAAFRAWLSYLGVGGSVKIEGRFTAKINKSGDYEFVKGWGTAETPLLLANSSDQDLRIPGDMKAHGVVVHPSPKLQTAVGWSSPITGSMSVQAHVRHAHQGCGNGVTWALEVRRGSSRQRLAGGISEGGAAAKIEPVRELAVRPGDVVSLLIGPRDANHSCDTTAVDLVLTGNGEGARTWGLAADISPDVLAGNPHADRFGNAGVWHFYTEPDKGGSDGGSAVPAGSLLAKWQAASGAEKAKFAGEVQALLLSSTPPAKDTPDAKLYAQIRPLLAGMASSIKEPALKLDPAQAAWGLDPALFGKSASGAAGDAGNLYVRAPSVIKVRLPADLVAGREFVVTGALEGAAGAEGSVQLQVLTAKPESASGLLASATSITDAGGRWSDNNQRVSYSAPIVVNEASAARKRIEAGLDAFRQLFPAALCYTKIVPVDEVVTLTLFHREDDHLARLMLDDAQKTKLDRLWDELHYVSHDALTLVDALEQLIQYATQDADPKVFEPMRKPVGERAAAFRKWLVETEPKHVEALLEFADRAYRRPLAENEKTELRTLYAKLREQELSHEEAVRLVIARVLVAPTFLYRAENPGPGVLALPVSDFEMATRLSYFLWSSMPDAELRTIAAAGKLREPGMLLAQTRRMLGDARTRRLATEFGCQWLHIHGFDTLDEKSERHFPTFGALRGAMYEESIRFFTEFFQKDGSVLGLLDSDHTFLNEALAKHYGIDGVKGEEWRRVDGVKKFARGGVLAQGATLAKQSGASRTSPILRGNWVAEALLGDKLPRPPKDVPQLPEDEATETLTVRQLTEKHTEDPRCYGCHQRIDAFGFALESFDAIGRRREKDLGGRPIDTKAKTMDGSEFDGVDGLRNYLLTKRRDAFLRQFCKKLLGYSLGRGVQLSDEPLLKEMQVELQAKEFRVSAALETIVVSRQFLDIRGREVASAE